VNKTANASELSRLFRVLADETRLRLLLVLRQGEQHVTALCRNLRLAQPTVSHHLGLLRLQGLVKNRRKGKQVYYSLDKSRYAWAAKAARAMFG
jgi:DNA-binding transcriptional ArsR family regulator